MAVKNDVERSSSSYRHFERSEKSLSFAAQGLALSPHVPRTSLLSPAVFHTARTLSGSLRSPPSPRGEGFDAEGSGILIL